MDIGPFDFNSIMLYGSYAFSKNVGVLPTITKNDGSTFTAQRTHLSPGDIQGINRLYPDICVVLQGSRPIRRGNDPLNTETYRTYKLKFYSEPGCSEALTLDQTVSGSLTKYEKSSQNGPYQYKGSYSFSAPSGVSSYPLDITTFTDIRRGANGNIEGYDRTKLELNEGVDYNKPNHY